MGEIGSAVADRARSFGMTIAYHNRRPTNDASARYFDNADELVAQSDVLVLTAPSTPQTRGFINAARLARARPSLILVNIARGDLVIDADLIAALTKHRIFAAALDVFNDEPHLDQRYLDLPNAFLLPHIGSSTLEARAAMGESVIRSVHAALSNEPDSARLG